MSELVSPPDPAGDPFTRIWHRADGSHAQYVQTIAELRERKRREQNAQELDQEDPLALPARAGWFLLRMGAYGLIGLAVFAFVAWVSVR
jgi:hypothetical protein